MTDTEKRLLPTIPGKVQGIVKQEIDEAGRVLYTLQCQGCGETERPWPLVTMTFKFCPVLDKKHRYDRLCPDCRKESLTGQGYSEREAHSIVTEGYIR